MMQNRSLDQIPSDALKLSRRLDILGIALALAYFSLTVWGEIPRMISNGVAVAFICVVVARLLIQRRARVPILVTGRRAVGYLILAAACIVAAVWFFPATGMMYKMLLLAVIPLTLGAGEFFRWRIRSRSL